MENQITEGQVKAIRRAHERLGRHFDKKEVEGIGKDEASASISSLHREVDEITYHQPALINSLHIARRMAGANGEDITWAGSSKMAAGLTASQVRDKTEGLLRDAHEQMENGARERVDASEAQIAAIQRCERFFPNALEAAGLDPLGGEPITKPAASLRLAILDRHGADLQWKPRRQTQTKAKSRPRGDDTFGR